MSLKVTKYEIHDYIGKSPPPKIKLQRSSKYDSEWMYKDSVDCIDNLGDNKMSRWDMDNEPEDKQQSHSKTT